MAEALRKSARTLQRRLHDEGGETLNRRVEAVRRERAAALLATSLPLSEVSQQLDDAPGRISRFISAPGRAAAGSRGAILPVEGTDSL